MNFALAWVSERRLEPGSQFVCVTLTLLNRLFQNPFLAVNNVYVVAPEVCMTRNLNFQTHRKPSNDVIKRHQRTLKCIERRQKASEDVGRH